MLTATRLAAVPSEDTTRAPGSSRPSGLTPLNSARARGTRPAVPEVAVVVHGGGRVARLNVAHHAVRAAIRHLEDPGHRAPHIEGHGHAREAGVEHALGRHDVVGLGEHLGGAVGWVGQPAEREVGGDELVAGAEARPRHPRRRAVAEGHVTGREGRGPVAEAGVELAARAVVGAGVVVARGAGLPVAPHLPVPEERLAQREERVARGCARLHVVGQPDRLGHRDRLERAGERRRLGADLGGRGGLGEGGRFGGGRDTQNGSGAKVSCQFSNTFSMRPSGSPSNGGDPAPALGEPRHTFVVQRAGARLR